MERIELMATDENRRPETTPISGRRRALPLLAAAALGLGGLLGAYLLLRHGPANGYARPLDDPLPIQMQQWSKPDLAILVTGQMHGYIDPCGCSAPQYGGLVRRYNFVDILKKRGWPIVGLDLGELLPEAKHAGLQRQALLKFQLSMSALEKMGYRAVGIGKNELALQLTDVLVQYSANHATPRPIALNLTDVADPNGIYHQLNARPYEIVLDARPKLGIVNMIGRDLTKDFETEKFLDDPVKAMKDSMQDFATAGVELAVVMYQEYPDPKKLPEKVRGDAGFNVTRWIEEERHKRITSLVKIWDEERQKDRRIPPLALVLNLTDEPEPPAQLINVEGTSTRILEAGHKGRFVGVVGVFRRGTAYELKYQLVSMEPAFDDRNNAKNENPVLDLMEKYADQVKKDQLLTKVARRPHPTQIDPELVKRQVQAKFIGSEKCGDCHDQAYQVWKKTIHYEAFDNLVKAQKPSNRQYDPECVRCHTVGFDHPTGFYDAPAGADLAKHNQKFLHVGCESCHGPGSVHANNPNDESLYRLINPFRASKAEREAAQKMADARLPGETRKKAEAEKRRLEEKRMDRIDFKLCQSCHDTDNDVNWSKVAFTEKWTKVVHNTPVAGNQAAPVAPKIEPPIVVPTGQQK
jgi:2',3'-cyclic-nucleotide 2'-phosphodiesterase (5'-nucleotidase family)